ncbi:slit homolog 3 protein-like [Bombus vosnesenskii]|uniref:Slit homolog 3 protein-like n=2 Tax=Pyrobombus TaxID=144703 RepID=A0A6J3KPW0_9HYME|nr:slit homolog 3 protein-like [Bombus vancouverensis nearcticus]XP_033297166.1 slit homolog 3 protein-like [Bombus bifarius]XP_033353909.1 slit homolog 3 protein-like [Bombus vosnesenskii]XP_050477941.1 slit homolog 3 protein-like [Bombus huntii]
MRGSLGTIILATCLAACTAICRPGLNGREDWYQCEGLSDLNQLQIPTGAAGINIIDSNISKIKTGAFSKYSDSLVELNITGCGVEDIEPDAFRGLKKLQVLGLVNNKIRKIDASWIRGLSSLKALILWRNRIVDIDPEIYDLLTELQVWDIAYNELNACLSPDMLRKLKKLRRILIAGNPWSYRCRSPMTWYLGSNHIRFIKDWSISDLLIEECLAHEPGAEQDDVILNKCVDRKVGSSDTLPYSVAGLNEQVRELTRKVFNLEADIATLKKSKM